MAIQEEKVELLRKIEIFSKLREYELDIIADYSEFVKAPKGEIIFNKGSRADELFVVSGGRVGIISVEDEDDIVVAQITRNESFGEFDFIGRAVRNATAFAEVDSVLLRFPARGHKSDSIFAEHPFVFATLLYRLLGIVSERIWNVQKLISERTDWVSDLYRQLHYDNMTGLYNQLYLKDDFISFFPDQGNGAALVMIKPDNFKEVNDRYSHDVGDKVLNVMAIFLQSELHEHDIGVRYKGDEYAAILLDTDREEALKRTERIRRMFPDMDLTGVIGKDEIRITVSIGIALYPDDTEISKELVTMAHYKMLRAREVGGNTVFI